MRDLKDVINQIMNLIKQDYDYAELHKQLNIVFEKIAFKAPELILSENWWNITYSILDKFVIPPKEEMDYKILSIWTTKSIEELKNMED